MQPKKELYSFTRLNALESRGSTRKHRHDDAIINGEILTQERMIAPNELENLCPFMQISSLDV
jgi:hypothetical protein